MSTPIKRTEHDIYPYISTTGRLSRAAKDKTILITGGGKGIGKSMTKHFALAGASRIYITGRSLSALQSAQAEITSLVPTCQIESRQCDSTSASDVEALFASLQDPTSGEKVVPDVLVNNAGVSSSQCRLVDSDPESWWRDWEVNVKGVYLVARSWLRALNGKKPGVMINTSSSVSDVVTHEMSSYGTSKHAVNRLTEMIHCEHQAQGVRCVAFHPGGIRTTGMGQTAPQQFAAGLVDTEDLAAATAVWLSGEEAGFLGGRFVYANWNMEALVGMKEDIVERDLLKARMECGEGLSKEVVI
jgi:NAD(P)-dependent dehydrogenase (short-subunit alcohol dehydrogenase family)